MILKPKEKAIELFDKFYDVTPFFPKRQNVSWAKQHALICVDEMLLELEDIEDGYRMNRVEYWEEVKQEIKNQNNKYL